MSQKGLDRNRRDEMDDTERCAELPDTHHTKGQSAQLLLERTENRWDENDNLGEIRAKSKFGILELAK
ncbi:MAG: hypothetical protein NVS2B14_00790 [Chamaesiphon sp.]